MDINKVLGQKSLVLVFTYAPTGLGHLRVTKALYEGLPKGVNPILLGAQAKNISAFHRITSIHPLTRTLFEIAQNGIFEDVFSQVYRNYLHSTTATLYQQLVSILDQQIQLPKTLLVVATHFSLAQQLSEIKTKLAREKKIQVFLIVQLTDDTPQHIWYVPRADLTFVPSERTREELARYGRLARLPPTRFVVTPYPVSPLLAKPLSQTEYAERLLQILKNRENIIHASIPISGAAVGLDFYRKLFPTLNSLSARFCFHIVCKIAPYTQRFLHQLLKYNYIRLHTSNHDREIVDKYEQMYLRHVISLEITKPSEQAFKALISPQQVGGAILYLATPVGRQEYDNVYFLRRHNLIPLESEQEYLWSLSNESKNMRSQTAKKLFKDAVHWRGLRLPDDPIQAAKFINWSVQCGLLNRMIRWRITRRNENRHAHELRSDGVEQFWKEVTGFLNKTTAKNFL